MALKYTPEERHFAHLLKRHIAETAFPPHSEWWVDVHDVRPEIIERELEMRLRGFGVTYTHDTDGYRLHVIVSNPKAFAPIKGRW